MLHRHSLEPELPIERTHQFPSRYYIDLPIMHQVVAPPSSEVSGNIIHMPETRPADFSQGMQFLDHVTSLFPLSMEYPTSERRLTCMCSTLILEHLTLHESFIRLTSLDTEVDSLSATEENSLSAQYPSSLLDDMTSLLHHLQTQ